MSEMEKAGIHSVSEAKERLQASRQALMHKMMPSTRGTGNVEKFLALDKNQISADAGSLEPLSMNQHHKNRGNASSLIRQKSSLNSQSVPDSRSSSFSAMVRRAFNVWWQFHPARALVAISEPFVDEFAIRHPVKLLGIAAGCGVVLVVVRPWRLVSIGGLALALLKSSKISNLALNFLVQRTHHSR